MNATRMGSFTDKGRRILGVHARALCRTFSGRAGSSQAIRQGVAVGLYQLVHESGYLVEGEQARGVPVEHRGVVDMLPLPFERGPDREVLDDHVRRAMRGELGRQGAVVTGPESGRIHGHRELDAAPLGEVFDQGCVLHVAVEHAWLAGGEGVDDQGPVLDAALQRERVASQQLAPGLGIPEKVTFAAAAVLVYRNVELFYELVALEEVRGVLGVVLA